MKPVKYSASEVKKIDLGTKQIFKYPTPTKNMDIGRMIIKGRHPKDPKTFIIEHACSFVIYIIKGNGKIYAGDKNFNVGVGDVIFVPVENKFAVEGEMEYITVDSPAFFLKQQEEIQSSGK